MSRTMSQASRRVGSSCADFARRIGIDVSKKVLDIFNGTTGTSCKIPNTRADIDAYLATVPNDVVVVYEATAPYDTELRQALANANRMAMRANPGRVRQYARSAGFLAKTDTIDAVVLTGLPDEIGRIEPASYDVDREKLASLHRRRDQLVETRAIERGRVVDEPQIKARESLVRHITWLTGEIDGVEAEIEGMLKKPAFAPTVALLKTVKGMGPVTITTLLALLPELGHRSAKSIAALAGLAPLNRDSGERRGRRTIGLGRKRIRRALYMAALAAIRLIPCFTQAYTAIKARSKSAKVAIIAVARKLLVTLNAMVKSGTPFMA